MHGLIEYKFVKYPILYLPALLMVYYINNRYPVLASYFGEYSSINNTLYSPPYEFE
ncbi:hypothetical protein QR305_00968 [Bacteroides finegoldii]|uniref:Uncharacterized protein n=1 Tax=Bacteroides finegoldii CL09T03C10 TaxID=997888 RepID=K5CLX7_9BACE|nr:hypothetical protein HMPREF1057_02750 [Bacteroides finegoldii CL09T03C10]